MVGFGYEPSYSLSFDNPALIFENGIGISVSSFYTRLNNKSVIAKNITGEDFKYKIYSQNLSVSKRFDHFNMSFINIGFSFLETGYSIMPITASGSRIDRVLSAGLSYIYDSRDLKQYSENGLFVFSNFTHKGFGINNINYSNFELDFREYRRIISSLSVKWRVVYRTSFGNTIPLYDYSSLGYFERVRGHYDDIREGKSYLVGSFELSYPLLKEWNLSLNLPLLPQSLTTTRIAIYLTGFADTGDAFGAGKPFSTGNFYSGYGFGITILFLPFNAVRFEYAMDEYGKGELIIGTGFSF
jgi:outer membrane protein assembly factor BamA